MFGTGLIEGTNPLDHPLTIPHHLRTETIGEVGDDAVQPGALVDGDGDRDREGI